jgi:hypothetical protein
MISVLNPITTTAASDCLAGKRPHHQSYQSAAGIRRSRAIRRKPTQRPVPKLALSDRPHDWGKVRRFPGERQAAVWISSFSLFLGRITAIQPPCHPPLGNDTEVADCTSAGSRRALSGVFLIDGSLWIGSPWSIPVLSVKSLRPW